MIHNGQVAWIGISENHHSDVFVYNGTDIIRLTHKAHAHYVNINDGIITWTASDGYDNEIYMAHIPN